MVRQFSDPSSNRSSRGIAMLKVNQVGVRTRAQASALATGSGAATTTTSTTSSATKKRSRQVKISFKVRNNVVDHRRPTPRVIIRREGNNSVPPTPELNPGGRTVNEERCLSDSLEDNHALLSTSCCSSNGSSSDERIKFADLEDGRVEVETSVCYSSGSCRERETTPMSSELREESSSEAMDSTTKSTPEVNSHHRSSGAKTLVTDEEVEKLFSEVEKKVPQRFKEKYNFDFDKDEPLEGRYEWVRLKP